MSAEDIDCWNSMEYTPGDALAILRAHIAGASVPIMSKANTEIVIAEIEKLRADVSKLETAHGQNMREIDKLRAELAAAKAHAEEYAKESGRMDALVRELRAELAVANDMKRRMTDACEEASKAAERYRIELDAAKQLDVNRLRQIETALARAEVLENELAAATDDYSLSAKLSAALTREANLRAELAAERERAKEAYDQGRASRSAVVAAGHALFVYAQKVTHKIKHHSLEKLLPSPDDELLAFIRAVDESSKSERARIDAALNGGGDE